MGKLIKSWNENPPLVVLVEALVTGLTGPLKPSENRNEDFSASKFRAEVGPAVPIQRGDPELPKNVTFDLEEMREKNKAVLIRRAAANV